MRCCPAALAAVRPDPHRLHRVDLQGRRQRSTSGLYHMDQLITGSLLKSGVVALLPHS